jgi:hypothetical protein
MLARVFNLLLAVAMAIFASLVAIGDWNAVTIGSLLFVACWVAGAIGLFFSNRVAWWSSLLCLGVMLAYWLGWVWEVWKLMQLQGDREPSASYGFTLQTGFVSLSISLVTSATMIGLIRLRKEMAGKWK